MTQVIQNVLTNTSAREKEAAERIALSENAYAAWDSEA